MGFRADLQRLVELKRANPGLSHDEVQRMLSLEKQEAHAIKFEAQFAANAVSPYVEVVPYKVFKKDINAFTKAYIQIVGLQPEDMFGIYTAPESEGRGDLSIVYRDRAEYDEGRRHYRRLMLGEAE